jgi:hypothetical protein
MSDIFNNPGAWVSGLLSPKDSKNVPKELREKIALAMMMQKRAYPKTFGEGLAAIGDAIGDRSVMRQLEAETAASEIKGKEFDDRISGAPPAGAAPAAVRRSYAPEDANTVVPQVQTVQQPLLPAQPLPPDQQQSEEPGAPVRMPTAARTQDWRNANPLPRSVVPPPQQPPPTVVQPPPPPPVPPQARSAAPPLPPSPPPQSGDEFNSRFAPATGGGRQSAIPGAPVMAEGNDPSAEEVIAGRNALAQALMQQQAARGGPQPLPTPRAVTPPPPDGGEPQTAIRSAPQPAPVRSAPVAQGPTVDPGYVPEKPPVRQPPPTTTLLLERIAKEIREATPADRGTIMERAAPYIQQEHAKISRMQEVYKDQLIHDRAIDLEREKALQTSAQRRETYKGTVQEQRKREQEIISEGGEPQATDPSLLGTKDSPQRDGRPRTPPTPPGQIPKDWAEKHTAELIKDAAGLETAKPELRETLDLMSKIRAHPSKEASLGTLGGLARFTAGGQGFAALHEQLLGKNLASVYQKIKGTGPVGEKEGENLAKAQSALRTAATKEDYDSALSTLETTLRSAVERMERKMHQPVTAYQKTPDDPVAPDIGQPSPGGTKIYIGGDPANPNSWKRR